MTPVIYQINRGSTANPIWYEVDFERFNAYNSLFRRIVSQPLPANQIEEVKEDWKPEFKSYLLQFGLNDLVTRRVIEYTERIITPLQSEIEELESGKIRLEKAAIGLRTLLQIADCPEVLIKNSNVLFGKPTPEDINWALKEVVEYQESKIEELKGEVEMETTEYQRLVKVANGFNDKISSLESENIKLREALKKLIPISERMQDACESGETKCYDNEFDAQDSVSYQLSIISAKQLLQPV